MAIYVLPEEANTKKHHPLAKGLVRKGRRIPASPDQDDVELSDKEASLLAVVDDAESRSVWTE